MKSRQETYDTVARALVKQGRPSVEDPGSRTCMYRSPDGCRCAAGMLIDDGEYSPYFEHTIVNTRNAVGQVVAGKGYDLVFVRRLQVAHDHATTNTRHDPDHAGWFLRWVERMRTLAAEHGLSTAALDEAIKEHQR